MLQEYVLATTTHSVSVYEDIIYTWDDPDLTLYYKFPIAPLYEVFIYAVILILLRITCALLCTGNSKQCIPSQIFTEVTHARPTDIPLSNT